MKKTYMHPEIKVVKIRNRRMLLTSGPQRGVYSGADLGDEFYEDDESY